MLVRLLSQTVAAALTSLCLLQPAYADEDRSAAIKQVTRGSTLSERSSASFDQIAPTGPGRRSAVEQIDPSLPDGPYPEDAANRLTSVGDAAIPPACVLTAEQQAIVTSLQSQGRLPAGDCEMLAWFAQPGDPAEGDDRRSLAQAVVTASPELLGQEAEADRQARVEADRLEAETAAAVDIAASILLPGSSGN